MTGDGGQFATLKPMVIPVSIQSKGFTPIADSQVRSTPSPRAAVPRDIRTPLDSAADDSASNAHIPHDARPVYQKIAETIRTALGPDVVPKGGARALTDGDIGSASAKPPALVK